MPETDDRSEQQKKRIAIVGGGVSGLATAYYLIQPERVARYGRDELPFDIEIIESTAHLGGNAETLNVVLGDDYGKASRPPYVRWVDLGVNDINLTSYRRIVEAMRTIGFEDYKPLEDTVCYFSLDGSIAMTDDSALEHGVSNPDLRVRDELARAYEQFMQAAVKAVQDDGDAVERRTVAEFVRDYREELNREQRALLDEATHTMLYPRIAAMYFVDERGPERMPLLAVMRYYILQENIAEPGKAKRMYFVGGSQKWIDRLAAWLQGEGRTHAQEQLPRVSLRYNYAAKVMVDEQGAWVYPLGERDPDAMSIPERFDKLVMATHADDALRSFRAAGLSEQVAEMLGKVSYTNSIAVAHTFTGVLPPDGNAWRTYNVMIRDGAAMTPYTMTYVINRHQNDAAEPEYDQSDLPQFFVTLTPAVRIPDNYVLRLESTSAEQRAGRGAAGYPKAGYEREQRAIGWFKHNVLDFDCLEAQSMVDEVQGQDHRRLYFAGGWTRGAGLHEECFEQAEVVAERIYEHEFGKPC
ncbi:MAG: FAD-dependent oxidoreductase [Gammaproteobacteria bacterium]